MAFPKPPTNAGPKALAIVEAANPQFQAEIAVVIAVQVPYVKALAGIPNAPRTTHDECIPTSHSDVSYINTQQSIRESRQM